ncbi:hypothetical protein [Streptomyces uncialis]|uniref:hypothetical protein n=1 Tax=Streptomyces uncialis TaxID=1048205 RepID=UPI0022577827|nr:hypothetical protein [Streptomyces uncialis]MCX4664752.1 hypothetical protein [Streptomyces uncialis]
MNAEPGPVPPRAPGQDGRLDSGPLSGPAHAPGGSEDGAGRGTGDGFAPYPERGADFRDNRQSVEQGAAIMGGVQGDVYNVVSGGPLDEALIDAIRKPRLREGPYPADEVRDRLAGFVEPPSHPEARKVLDGRVLLLRGGPGAGAATAAFALLAERYGEGGVTGLDSAQDLLAWRPKGPGGYLLQGLPRDSGEPLGEVALTALARTLRHAGAHLVVTLAGEVRLPADTGRWQAWHLPPASHKVAARRLRFNVREGRLDPAHLDAALGSLASAPFTDYLAAHPLPGDAVDVADALCTAAATGTSPGTVLDELRPGSATAARVALDRARHSAGALSLMAAIALLAEQDRTVIEQFAAVLRPLIDERAGPARHAPATGNDHPPDLLGPSFEDRLEAVGARLLPPGETSTVRHGHPVRRVVFAGRHRSEAVLGQLWLDHEGMPELLSRALTALPPLPGAQLAAGLALGRVLAHATGPGALGPLPRFAASEERRERRLAAVALGELVQHPARGGTVRELLRRWSCATSLPLRCTVAETCGSGFGLARPALALRFLDNVLDGPESRSGPPLRTAVSFALSVLLTEEPHHPLVLDTLREWLTAPPGTARRAQAGHVIDAMSRSAFPPGVNSGASRTTLAMLLRDHPDRAPGLVALALGDPAVHEATAQGLARIEADPDTRMSTAFPHFLSALSTLAPGHRGVVRYLLHRHRARTTVPTEEALT